MKLENKRRRVVVTGLGVVSSLGIGWQDFWKNLMAGKSGISRISSFDTSQHDSHFAGEIKNFTAEQFIDPRKICQIGRTSQMAIAASKLALRDGGISERKRDESISGVAIGTTLGESRVIENIVENNIQSPLKVIPPLSVISSLSNTVAANIAKELKLNGCNFVFSNACAAGNFAVGWAFDLVRLGKVDYMLAGGAEALSRIGFTGFSRLYAMAPEKCQPFDKNRKGMMTGEGAAVILIESMENALSRGANIYSEILGYGLSCDAQYLTIPSMEGIRKAIKHSLIAANISEDSVDYINAHGTGTHENDKAECQAIRRIFGERSRWLPISSIKSMLGHAMGAASAFESIACCLASSKNEIPPTINFEEKDPDCDIDCVPNHGRSQLVNVVLNNSQAFGGNNACLVFSKFVA